ncbi:aldo/keto reductase [Vibrio cholerae]|nr:aldo/keto reductase [Vibrio cholerae]
MNDIIYTLNNGVTVPALGLGVYQSGKEETVESVKFALNSGYRMIDTAAAYANEKEVGLGIKQSDVAREDIFVQSKLWMSDYGYDNTLRGFERSLKHLGLDTLDSFLLHWPIPSDFDKTISSWKALVRLQQEGRIRVIGVCNSLPSEIVRLQEETGVLPAINQVELHPYLSQPELHQAHQDMGVLTQAWAPIGGIMRYQEGSKKDEDPLSHPVIVRLANKYQKTSAQIVLRWHLERGISVIPKSVKPARIQENGNIFDFQLSKDEVQAIDEINQNLRGGPDPQLVEAHAFDEFITLEL